MEPTFRLTIWHRNGLPEKPAVGLVRASSAGDQCLVTQIVPEAQQFALASAIATASTSVSGTRYLEGAINSIQFDSESPFSQRSTETLTAMSKRP